MKALHKPIPTTTPLLVALLSMAMAVPVLAANPAGKTPSAAGRKSVVQAKTRPLPAAAQVAVTSAPAVPKAAAEAMQPSIVTPVATPAERGPTVPSAAAVMAAPVAVVQAPALAAVAISAAAAPGPAAAPQNPYLAGWYRPVPAAALPAMAVGQLNYNARYVSDAVTSIPAKVVDALPSIKTVHPTGGRDLVVANLKCPAEMITGQYFIPANAMREGINGLFNRLNDSQLLKFDIQLVCS